MEGRETEREVESDEWSEAARGLNPDCGSLLIHSPNQRPGIQRGTHTFIKTTAGKEGPGVEVWQVEN